MSDKKQQEAEQPRRQNKGWSWGKGIIMIVLGGFSLFICCLYLFPELICWLLLSPEQWVTNKHVWLKLYLGALAFTGGVVLCIPRVITSNPKKYFITRVLVTGITGGAFALLLPIAVKSTTTGVGGLRHSILLATGGLLAILTLGETRRKNDIDKRKNKQEKKKNDKDHRRQVRAERRERYAKAVEQLGDEKAPIRMGGVYTLVGLVDEWLEDKSLSDDQRLKEGQVIINNLCAYIRSPFTLASYYDELSKPSPKPKGIYKGKKEKFYADKSTLDSEADVRLSIIKEIHDRLQGSSKNTPGVWSDFEYDFSGSVFFYPVDLTKSYYKNPAIFNNSHYYKKVYFSGSIYNSQVSFRESIYKQKVTFSSSKSRSIYKGEADFSGSKYHREADFSGSEYHREADFRGSIYKKKVTFSNPDIISLDKPQVVFNGSNHENYALFDTSDLRSTYHGTADFSGSEYHREADFRRSIYKKDAIFSTEHLRSTYQDTADFSGSTYGKLANFSYSTYGDNAIFSVEYVTYEEHAPSITEHLRSTYHGIADFRGSTYGKRANFSYSTYGDNAIFSTEHFRSTYQDTADFHGSTYGKRANFSYSTYQDTADFHGSTYGKRANFSYSTYKGDAIFSTNTFQSIYKNTADFSKSFYLSSAEFANSACLNEINFSYSTYRKDAIFTASSYKKKVDFSKSIYNGKTGFNSYTHEDRVDFSSSIFIKGTYFGGYGNTLFSPCFTSYKPCFYNEQSHKNTLFGLSSNDFTVDINKGHSIALNTEGLPLGCKFLTSEQKEYLADKFQEIEETNNKILEVKDPEGKVELSKKLWSINEELHEWRKEATTVKVEDVAAEDTES